MRTEDVQRPTQSMSTDLPGVTEFKGAQSPPLDPDIIDVEPESSDCCFREHENRSNNSLKRIAESEATHPPKTKTARLFSKDKPSAAEITTSNGFSSASPVVGSRVMNWWRDDSKSRGSYYSGRVEEVNRETGEVLVQYEDGDIAWEGVNPKENPGFVVLGTAKKLPKYPMNAVFFKSVEGFNRIVGRIARFDGEQYHVFYPRDGSSQALTESSLDGNTIEFLPA